MDTRERLIESTQELLWERGYVGTSPKAIQQRAQAGQGSMYHHFTGKADLARAAIERSGEQLKTRAEETLSGPGTAFERISAFLLRERDVLRGCRIGRLAQDPDIIANPDLRQPVEGFLAWLRNRLAAVLEEGRARGEFDQIDVAETAAAIAAVLQGGYVLARAAQSVEPFHQAVNGMLYLLAGRVRTGAR